MNKIKALVAISGGVDSSVSAALLKEQGYDVTAVHFKMNENSNSEKKALAIAKKLNVPFFVLDARKDFKKKVFDYFLKEYKSGRTPNPCVVCNREIKFDFLIKKALSLKADFIATGHYARIKQGKLLKGFNKDKDQSYFLWKLKKNQLEKILFPLGGYKKKEVRNIARTFKLPSAEAKESQEVCFIEKGINDFLRKHLKTKPGKILDIDKKEIGSHNGLWFYTIGQRKGIGLPGGPYYVVAKDLKRNNLIVSKNLKDLVRKEVSLKDINLINNDVKFPFKAMAKIRYRSKSYPAVVYKNKAVFLTPQKSITPGQSAVFYKGHELLGGGIII